MNQGGLYKYLRAKFYNFEIDKTIIIELNSVIYGQFLELAFFLLLGKV